MSDWTISTSNLPWMIPTLDKKETKKTKRTEFIEVFIILKSELGPRDDMLTVTVSAARIINILSSNGLRPLLRYSRIGDDEDDGSGFFGYRRRAPRRAGGEQFPKVPSEAGRVLMSSGDFGSNAHYVDELKKRRKALATKLMWRELGVDVNGARKRATQSISQVSTQTKRQEVKLTAL